MCYFSMHKLFYDTGGQHSSCVAISYLYRRKWRQRPVDAAQTICIMVSRIGMKGRGRVIVEDREGANTHLHGANQNWFFICDASPFYGTARSCAQQKDFSV